MCVYTAIFSFVFDALNAICLLENPESCFLSLTEMCFDVSSQASGTDGTPSVLTSSISSGDATSSIKGETGQESVAEQGVYYPPTSCYDYYYPG